MIQCGQCKCQVHQLSWGRADVALINIFSRAAVAASTAAALLISVATDKVRRKSFIFVRRQK